MTENTWLLLPKNEKKKSFSYTKKIKGLYQTFHIH